MHWVPRCLRFWILPVRYIYARWMDYSFGILSTSKQLAEDIMKMLPSVKVGTLKGSGASGSASRTTTATGSFRATPPTTACAYASIRARFWRYGIRLKLRSTRGSFGSEMRLLCDGLGITTDGRRPQRTCFTKTTHNRTTGSHSGRIGIKFQGRVRWIQPPSFPR